ncbi:MAG TPA: DinB family protein [Thermoanaerobaculia bacterium]|nr:DinB family protein [Thermoanaerobaculia bacterium]
MKIAVAPLLVFLAVTPLAAAQTEAKPPAPASKNGFRAEFVRDLDAVQTKILDLARAIPAEKYTWRPADGVRSISEVFMHIAGGNYFLGTFLGVQPPAGMPKDLEKITDKAQVLAELQKSFDHLRSIVKNISDADLEKAVTLFGNPTTQRGVLVTALNHLHEHLGQSIAYARMNGIAPPWSN